MCILCVYHALNITAQHTHSHTQTDTDNTHAHAHNTHSHTLTHTAVVHQIADTHTQIDTHSHTAAMHHTAHLITAPGDAVPGDPVAVVTAEAAREADGSRSNGRALRIGNGEVNGASGTLLVENE